MIRKDRSTRESFDAIAADTGSLDGKGQRENTGPSRELSSRE